MSSMTVCQADELKVKDFADRLVQILNDGALNLMIGIGHRTRLFDAMAELPPSTSEAIAERAGLNERYVREWLGAMVTGRIVNYDPDDAHVRAAGRACGAAHSRLSAGQLCRHDAVDGRAGQASKTTSWIASTTAAACHYEEFHRFHEVMAEESCPDSCRRAHGSHLAAWPMASWNNSNAASTFWTSAAAAAGPCASWRPIFPNSTFHRLRPV